MGGLLFRRVTSRLHPDRATQVGYQGMETTQTVHMYLYSKVQCG
jgi:hypothetical protein